nr:unnamed protein product [Digitaria exilis]
MEPQRTVRMNPGEGEASYARNSTFQLQQAPPELGLLLNDLPSNDFNTAVKHLVAFQQKQNVDKSERGSSPTPHDLVKNGLPM